MKSHENCPCSEECTLIKVTSVLGGKWKLPIICSLMANGPSRYNRLLKKIQGISNTMLSQTLRELEEDGIVKRTQFMEVPIRVEYSLTEKGNELKPILESLIRWSLE